MCKFIINKFILSFALVSAPLTVGVVYADDATAPTTAPVTAPVSTPTQAPVLPSTDEQSPLQHMRDEANPPPNYIPEDPNVDVNGNYPPPPPPSSNVEIINPSSTPNVEVQAPDVEVDSDYYGGYGYDGYGYGYDRRGDRLERHNDNYNSERREQYNQQQMRQQEHRQEQQHHEQQQHHESEHRSGGGHMGGGGHGGGGRR